jgi:hypothetical protein
MFADSSIAKLAKSFFGVSNSWNVEVNPAY